MDGFTVWITGLSASGKSTLAGSLHSELKSKGIMSVILDADEIRHTLNSDLGYSIADREENNRRVGEIAKIINDSGVITICAFITPTDKIRRNLKSIIGADKFRLVFIDTPIEVCEKRDFKDLYKRARRGELKDFSGISSAFETPSDLFLKLDGLRTVAENRDELLGSLGL